MSAADKCFPLNISRRHESSRWLMGIAFSRYSCSPLLTHACEMRNVQRRKCIRHWFKMVIILWFYTLLTRKGNNSFMPIVCFWIFLAYYVWLSPSFLTHFSIPSLSRTLYRHHHFIRSYFFSSLFSFYFISLIFFYFYFPLLHFCSYNISPLSLHLFYFVIFSHFILFPFIPFYFLFISCYSFYTHTDTHTRRHI